MSAFAAAASQPSQVVPSLASDARSAAVERHKNSRTRSFDLLNGMGDLTVSKSYKRETKHRFGYSYFQIVSLVQPVIYRALFRVLCLGCT